MTVSPEQVERVADALWDQMVGVAKSSVREAVADAFKLADIPVGDDERKVDISVKPEIPEPQPWGAKTLARMQRYLNRRGRA